MFALIWFVVLILIIALALTASQPPKARNSTDIFGFADVKTQRAGAELPELQRFVARDGSALSFRFYDSTSDRILIFVHGSSYHGGGYHTLAAAISSAGCAKVALPNLRGHYQSGRRRGDVDYIGQLEHDLTDLIAFLRKTGSMGPITLGGHSSGGGFVIRFAGGANQDRVSSYLILAPVIPKSPAVRLGTAGGWASLNLRRIYGLIILNTFMISGFNGLPVIEFNKPEEHWDGTETLSYSYRLNVSYHPRHQYARDLRAVGRNAFILIGEHDEAIDPAALRRLLEKYAPDARFSVLPSINHFGIFAAPVALDAIIDWLRAQ